MRMFLSGYRQFYTKWIQFDQKSTHNRVILIVIVIWIYFVVLQIPNRYAKPNVHVQINLNYINVLNWFACACQAFAFPQ